MKKIIITETFIDLTEIYKNNLHTSLLKVINKAH